MIKMDYGDAEHIKNLEATFMALLDDVDKRQNIWVSAFIEIYAHRYKVSVFIIT